MKRVMLFILTNIAIMAVFSVIWAVVVNVFGVDPTLTTGGDLNYTSTLILCAVLGMTGAFVSLFLSKWAAKRMTGAYVIGQPRNAVESWLVATVQRQAQAAGIGMPEVAIFDSPEPNAFATGANRNNALVAVSTGLLQRMKREEVEAVLGHEVSHVANGDMITLTLIQGVVNTFVFFIARVVGHFIDRAILKNEQGYGIGYFVSVLVLQVLLGFVAAMIVAWFSRQREFRADAGGARLAGRGSMVSALRSLESAYGQSSLPKQMAAFGINGGFGKLFATHPPIARRIAALEAHP